MGGSVGRWVGGSEKAGEGWEQPFSTLWMENNFIM